MNPCPICDNEKTKELLSWKKFTINKCRNCQLIFTIPLPSDNEIVEFYQGFMFKKPENSRIQRLTQKRKKELKKYFSLTENTKDLSNKKFLDFGGGTGVAYNALREIGFDTYYHDLDKEAIAFTMEKFGLKSNNTVHNIKNCDIKFDYIFSDNVIEHVKYPYNFLNDLIDQLNEGGTIVIKTPHASNTESIFNPNITIKGYFLNALKYNSFLISLQAYFSRFWHCDPPRHLYSFSKNSLVHLMLLLKADNIDFEILYYRSSWFDNTITKQFFTVNKRIKSYKSFMIRLIVLPIIPLEVLLQITRQLLLQIRVLSAGGIILKINKQHKS